jgi:site-specific DNA-cytosine methylase
MNILSLFDGISVGYLALQKSNLPITNYYASEIDKNAIKVSNHHFPKIIQLGPVQNIISNDLPKIDLLIGGSPCQGFSKAGNQLNFQDPRSKLFFEFVRLKNELNPTYFLLENNPMKQEYQNVISQYLNIEPIKINSNLVSAQNRNRLYWTNIPTQKPKDQNILLKNIIGEYQGIYVYPRGYNKGGIQSYKGKSPTITISAWQHNFFIFKNNQKIKFTPEIAEQLQTLPINYTNVNNLSINQRFKLIGNSWTLNVISHIFNGIQNEQIPKPSTSIRF